MKPLTEKQVTDLREREKASGRSAEEHDRLAGEALWQADAMSADITADKPGAVDNSRKRRRQAEEHQIMADAFRREAQIARDALDADEPNRIAKERARLTAEASAIAGEIMQQSTTFTDHLRSAVACLHARRDLAQRLNLYREVFDGALPDVGHYIMTLLANAGMVGMSPQFMATAPLSGPENLAEHDAQNLAPLLPHDHPAVSANRARAAEVHRQYLAQNPAVSGRRDD